MKFLATADFPFELITENGRPLDPVKIVRTIVVANESDVERHARFKNKALVDRSSGDPASI